MLRCLMIFKQGDTYGSDHDAFLSFENFFSRGISLLKKTVK